MEMIQKLKQITTSWTLKDEINFLQTLDERIPEKKLIPTLEGYLLSLSNRSKWDYNPAPLIEFCHILIKKYRR